ncbi:MAG: DegT/DnrJ/EryC1/StrS family aminotransferase [Chloroflexi bacterium]|nr:DegT/DnrJ/EryC1/StrS family aminotransferase [Chloroflexota bacterium]
MTEKRFIPVAAPVFAGNEKKYVMDCLETTWISSKGKYVTQFEESFAAFCGVKHAMLCSSGTTALHLGLLALGVGPGDEVILPTLTFVSTANAVMYCGATPVFVDSLPDTWNLDPAQLAAKITPRTKAIIVVHLYGLPCDMDAVQAIADAHHVPVLEDAAEAHGAVYQGQRAGALGKVGMFSFYGNKTITTGEGGMVTTGEDDLAEQVRLLRGQGQDPNRRYWFPVIGYNYRLTNIQAAIGLAQLEQADFHLGARRDVYRWYREELAGVDELVWQTVADGIEPTYWMVSVVLGDNVQMERDAVMAALRERGIETRPLFYPIHTLPPYHDPARHGSLPVAERLAARGINLPTWAGLTRDDVRYISQSLLACIR